MAYFKRAEFWHRTGQLGAFALAMQEGDIVVLPRKLTSQIAIGRVTGPYRYQHVNTVSRHTRPVEWLQRELPRTTFEQDLLYSFGAFMTVCNISRHDAARRVVAVLEGKPDPGPSVPLKSLTVSPPPTDESESIPDLSQVAHDQIVAQIQSRFAGHGLARLVDAVLRADGWVTKISPAWARRRCGRSRGKWFTGLDVPRLCVQVKSQNIPADVTVYRTLKGTMHTFKAEQGLLVCLGRASTRRFYRNRSRATSWCVCGTAAISWEPPTRPRR